MPPTPHTFRSATSWAFVMNLAQRGVSLIVMFVLAALLGPHEFGLVALALGYVAFVELFLEQGVITALVQRTELQRADTAAALLFMVVAGCTLTGATFLTASAIAGWNQLPRLAPLLQALSLMLLFRSLAVVPEALLQRDMNFRALALRTTLATLSGGAVGIVTACNGAGPWALVYQQLTTSGLALLLVWMFARWKPTLNCRLADLRRLLAFTVHILSGRLAVFINRRLDVLIIGACFGPAVVGVYRLADRLISLVIELATRPLQMTALPHFARQQTDPQQLRGSVLRAVHLSAILAVPALAVLAAAAPGLPGLLGAEWAPTVAPLRILAIGGVAQALALLTGPTLMALGKPRAVAALNWLLAIAMLGGLALLGWQAAALSDPLAAMAAAGVKSLAFAAVLLPMSIYLLHRTLEIRPRVLFIRTAPALLAGVAAALTGGLLTINQPHSPVASMLTTGGAVAAAGALACLVLLLVDPESRRLARTVWTALRPPRTGTPQASTN